MPFVPLSAGSFPRVSPADQAARDAEAEQILRAEFDQDMPDENRAALEAEYQQRFGKAPPPVQRGFIPLANAGDAAPQRGFIPIESGEPSTVQRAAMAAEPYITPALKTAQAVASGYPVAETAANLLTMGVALPAAGLAGIGTAAARALGLTDKEPADVVHAVSGAMTYQPKTELGQHLTGAAMYPFEMLAKGGAAAGDKVLNATGSPVAATAVDTAINALPMAIAPAAKGIQAARARLAPTIEPVQIDPVTKVSLAQTPDEAIAAIGELGRSLESTADFLHDLPPIPAIIPPAIPRPILPAQGMPPAIPTNPGMVAPGVNAGARPGFISAPDVAMAPRPAVAPAPMGMPPAALEAAPAPAAMPPQARPPTLAEMAGERANPPAPVPAIEIAPGQRRGFIPLENIDAQPIPEGARRLAPDDQAMLGPDRQGLEALRGPGRDGLPAVAEQLRDLPSGRGPETIAGPVALAGEARNPGELRAGERDLAEAPAADFAPAVLPPDQRGRGIPDHPGSRPADRLATDDVARPAAETRGGTAARDIPGAAALSERLEVPDPRRADAEHAGMGEVVGREGANPAREGASGIAAGTGAEAGRSEKAGFAPLRDTVDAAAHEAAASLLNDRPQPTPAQIEAGNFKKGAVKLHGMAISIENPAGSIRRGTDASGRAWENEMQHHYGYIKGSLAKDGDHVDVFIGERPASPRAFVIDQIDPKTGKYDEPKVVLGARNEADARRIYQANYAPGWKGLGAITEMEMDAFRGWVKSNDTTKPVGLPRILGKSLTEYSDAALSRLDSNKTLPKSARTKVEAEIERRRDVPASAAAEAERSSIIGRPISKMSDTQLENWSKSTALPEKTRAKVDAEIERRAASADSSAAPVRAQIEEPSSDPLLKDVEVQDMAAPKVQNGTWSPGANYAPFVDQMRTPDAKATSVTDLPAPKRRERIIKEFADAIGTTVYEGRVKGKKRLGFFRPGVEEVRIKNAADIEVTAHEVAHLIDHRVPELQQAWRSDKALAAELKSVSYDQKNVREGFAEGVRLFLTQPDVLEARAPKVYAWLEAFTQDHKYGPALRKAQDQMTGWFGQDALNRARSKIGSEKPLAEYFDGFWDKLRQSTVDDLHGIMKMERSMTGKISPNGPYESARLSRASASIADGAMRFGYPEKARDGSFAWKGQGLEDILKPVAEKMDDALLYFVGRSANELMGQRREHLFTKGEIDGMLNLRTPEREKAFQDYQAWNKGILDFAEAQGVINPESRRLWQRTQYLPFHRVEQPGGLKGKPGDWSGIQALTGGTTNIKDVLGNMIGNAAMLLDKAVKNEARLKVARLSQMPGGGNFMVKIDTESRPVKISGDQVLEAMLKKYGIAIDGDAPAFFEFLIKGQPPAGRNVVAVLQQGKPVWFEVGDPILYRSLSAMDRPVQSEVLRWLGLPKRVGQLTITATADFWMANIARDTLMGSVMSRAGFRPVLDSLDGMRMRMTTDPLYKEWVANGGGLSSIYLDEAKFRTKLEKFYGRQGIDYHTVVDSPAKLMNMIETLGDAFESSTRLGEYKRAKARGENPRHAAYLAREVSTDFAMKGDSKALGFMYDTVMFLRPAVVSWDRLARGLTHDPNKGAIAAKAGTIAMLSAGLYLLNKDDPRYADLPDWDRDTNWHFFVGEHHFRYPKIWEIGSIASLAERSTEKLIAADPSGLGKDFARIVANTFHLNLTPQIIAPLADQAANRNAFTKAPIETPGMENVQPFLRSKTGTSETMKAAGMATRDLPESMQVNPARAEALLRGYFNTWALYGLMATDQAFFGDKLPEKRADELPVVRRFYANEPAKHTKYETVFYDLLQESKRLRGTMKELDEMGLRTFADDKEKEPLATEAKPLERAAKSLGVINNEVQEIRRNVDLTPTEKRQKLDALTVERNALLKTAVTESKAAQKEREK